MRNLILAAILGLLVLSPLTAAAQQKPAPPPTVAEGVSSAKVLAIGIGALLGVVAGQAIAAGEGVTLIGGAAGGLLAAWWYDSASNSPTRAAMRENAGTPALARAERIVSIR
ncbi:MAG TPA: hypothetical protein VGQ90_16685 [Stellaceae bacterium]|jgi:hypothetical protein|nr:hypothetical protein [Stellaceae bacterium]